MFEFSCPSAKNAGFRSLMAERVSRLFEADETRDRDLGVSRSELSGQLRQKLRAELSSKLRPQLCLAGVRSVSAQQLSQPRLSASRKVGPKSMLKSMASQSKRAASALVFKRIAERLNQLRPMRLVASSCSVLRPSSVRQSCVASSLSGVRVGSPVLRSSRCH